MQLPEFEERSVFIENFYREREKELIMFEPEESIKTFFNEMVSLSEFRLLKRSICQTEFKFIEARSVKDEETFTILIGVNQAMNFFVDIAHVYSKKPFRESIYEKLVRGDLDVSVRILNEKTFVENALNYLDFDIEKKFSEQKEKDSQRVRDLKTLIDCANLINRRVPVDIEYDFFKFYWSENRAAEVDLYLENELMGSSIQVYENGIEFKSFLSLITSSLDFSHHAIFLDKL